MLAAEAAAHCALFGENWMLSATNIPAAFVHDIDRVRCGMLPAEAATCRALFCERSPLPAAKTLANARHSGELTLRFFSKNGQAQGGATVSGEPPFHDTILALRRTVATGWPTAPS
jgi:hypothetical protein